MCASLTLEPITGQVEMSEDLKLHTVCIRLLPLTYPVLVHQTHQTLKCININKASFALHGFSNIGVEVYTGSPAHR